MGIQLSLAVSLAAAHMLFKTVVAELLDCETTQSKFAFDSVFDKNDLRQWCACMLIAAITNYAL